MVVFQGLSVIVWMITTDIIHTITEYPMKEPDTPTKAVVTAFRKRKILTFDEIKHITNWSAMALWRNLKPIGYYTSFNYNARFYTLADIPRFDKNGLWFYKQAGFSSSGTLNRTLISLVNNSTMGMTPAELSLILKVRVQNQLAKLYTKKKIDRVQCGRAYLYVSLQEEVKTGQLKQRENYSTPEKGDTTSPTVEEIIQILSELVRRPRASARGVSYSLCARGFNVSRQKVLDVIEKYQLKKKRRSKHTKH